jgi:hypothetical protein
MTNETKHTPTPKELIEQRDIAIAEMYASSAAIQREIAKSALDAKQAIIDELVAAIEAMLPCTISGLSVHNSRAIALAAIAKARGEVQS